MFIFGKGVPHEQEKTQEKAEENYAGISDQPPPPVISGPVLVVR
jgi:hypothetical protein